MTDQELSRLTYMAANSFANVKYVPTGYVGHSVEAAAARLGLHPTPEEKVKIVERLNKALAYLFSGTIQWVPPRQEPS